MVKVNGIEKEFIVDTGSPISIMPVDEKILKQTEIQKVKQRYQDVNKNEVKFRRKVRANIEYENNKQKMQILITKRNDITPLLGMDWMKKFNLTIGDIRTEDINQSEKRRVIEKFPDIQKQHHDKRYRKKYSAETGTLSGETKSKTDPITSTRGGLERTRKIEKKPDIWKR